MHDFWVLKLQNKRPTVASLYFKMILKLFLAFGSGFIRKLSKFAKQCYVYRRIKKIWLFENLGIALASWYDFDILITVRIISIFFFTRIRIGSSFTLHELKHVSLIGNEYSTVLLCKYCKKYHSSL